MPKDHHARPTDRSRLRRTHERGAYDRESLYAVLDAQPLCTIGYVIDGKPFATPTLQWREGNHVYWHGSSASRMLKASRGKEVCLTVSCLDGWVLARSAMHHSVNFRSALLFGTPFQVEAPEDKTARLRTMMERLFPGRWEMLRAMTEQELKATMVLGMDIDEGAAKVRSGPPKDDEADYVLPIWAGVIPVRSITLPPLPDPRNLEGVAMPAHVSEIGKDRLET
ncbi:pyridoxamine 5'-phosphate oxidase family protein [Tropicimonas sp. IMCC6043]|uniref:pyridoxamine 5'-phosphate oxidase family protein n=1 Tax=Tropicimonas sp. IMCC6043 TaxID=2510645 RepID=UPI00101E14FD|nr:pyridoxamine 5'-phosphate oxidase family protein [Tropicimonas sp. IMCC6043]RYH07406.1 pyridoxamine 5'-phosphate oxidase family protein [Tropicimonas sp. IMCC6043]